MPSPLLSRLRDAALDFVFPPRCAACGHGGSFLHPACAAQLLLAAPPRCPLCWEPSQGGPCGQCRQHQPTFEGLRAPFVMQGGAQAAVHALKYRGLSAAAPAMGELLAAEARSFGLPADVVTAVPLTGGRRRVRGYNQAALLARAVAGSLDLPFAPAALRRVRAGPPQARAETPEERWRNVAGAFAARRELVAGLRVLVIDDVATTGATLDACARALKDAGAASVWCLAWAKDR